MSPQDVAGWFKWISLEKAIQYSKEGLHFYARPKTFFENIFKKTAQEIIIQLFFYLLVMVAIVMLISSHDLKTMGRRIFISFIIQVSVSLIPALIGIYFTDKIFSIRDKFEVHFFKLLTFNISMFIFISPIMAIPLAFYLETQKYEFLLAALILSNTLFYINNVFYSKLIFVKLKHAIISSILTLICWNLLVTVAVHMPAIDTYNSNKLIEKFEIDPVYTEYDKLGSRVELYNIFDIPSSKTELAYGDTILYFFNFENTTPYIDKIPRIANHNIKKTDSVLTSYKNSETLLRTAIDSLKFERNKIFFNNLSNYYKSIIKYGSQPQDTSAYARKALVHLGNKDAMLTVYATPLSAPHVQQFLLLSNNMHTREEARNMAMTPTSYGNAFYFLPAYLLDKLIWQGDNIPSFSD